MKQLRLKRLYGVFFIVLCSALAFALVYLAIRDNVNLFYSPSDLFENPPQGRNAIRAGGLVEIGSLKRSTDSLDIEFIITDLKKSINGSDAIFIAVGTPSRKTDGHADLSYVYAVAEEIAECLGHYSVIVNKSTVPIGTGKKVYEIITFCYQNGYSEILIITGKGIHSKSSKNVYISEDFSTLKNTIPDFIKNNSDLSSKISGIEQADKKSGGSGAFLIKLKRL